MLTATKTRLICQGADIKAVSFAMGPVSVIQK